MEQELNFTKGFNDGYKLKRFQPEIYDKLEPSLSEENAYERGILAGAKEYENEREKARLAELENIQEEQDPEQDIER